MRTGLQSFRWIPVYNVPAGFGLQRSGSFRFITFRQICNLPANDDTSRIANPAERKKNVLTDLQSVRTVKTKKPPRGSERLK